MSNAMGRPKEHALKREVQQKRIPLWQIRRALGGLPSESRLSRMLCGIDPMPGDIQKKIETAIQQAV